MEIICGTKNNAKLTYMRKCLSRLRQEYGIEIIGLCQLDFDLPDVPESGSNPLDNARIKALSYYDIVKRPVFSCDSGLYFEGLSEDLQPGVNVRNVNNKRLSDDEMIEYYSHLARANGGRLIGRYINGICLVMGEGLIYEHMGDDIATGRFIIADAPHVRRVDGFPLDSLSVQIKSNKYYYDLDKSENERSGEWNTDGGFYMFFKTVMEEGKQRE